MTPQGLDATQLDRYSRHVIMADVGPDGQSHLLESGVLVVGAGGLGSPIIQYLAAAGVGRLGIADADEVELSNLQRQVLHGTADVGLPKVESAAAAVADLNPDVTVERHPDAVTAETAPALVADYDVVVDASDNFPTRYLLNDACVLANVPLVHGAVYQFEGQATTIPPGGTPCYRCLYPEAPPEGTVPDCAEAGVFGVLPGTVGTIQATEALKLLLDVGEPLADRLLVYDAGAMSLESVPVRPDPTCPVCGDEPRIEAVTEVGYDDRCAIPE
jgi:molybdopterin/thiamine biosynthesis adenylyltransferase